MPRQTSLNTSRTQSNQKNSYDPMDFTLCPKKPSNPPIHSQQRQPNFGTKRTYSDKENQNINCTLSGYQDQINSSQNHSLSTETQKTLKNKKYAYIKTSNSLIHSQKYTFDQNHSHQSTDNNYFPVFGNTETDNPRISSSQKPRHDPILTNKQSQHLSFASKDQQIEFLRHSLQQQKLNLEQFQQQTIKNQIKILETIANLQNKLKQLKHQNSLLHHQNQSLKIKLQDYDQNLIPKLKKHHPEYHNITLGSEFDQIKQLNFEIERLSRQLETKDQEIKNILQSYKKIKGVAKGLVDMMKKVDNLQTPQGQDQTKYAWKWIKKLVWQYEAIRKKAYQWKKAYDELNKDSENELSVSSEDIY